MLNLYIDILDSKRAAVFEKLHLFCGNGILVGGTAIALQINHRVSYDFDLFYINLIDKKKLLSIRKTFPDSNIQLLVDNKDELSVLIDDVKVSLIYFPFKSIDKLIIYKKLKLNSLLELAFNKAYAIGRRGEYRDYVDMYFLLKQFDLFSIIEGSKKKFGDLFNEKLFIEQLVYLDDIDEFDIDYINERVSILQIKSLMKKVVNNYISNKIVDG